MKRSVEDADFCYYLPAGDLGRLTCMLIWLKVCICPNIVLVCCGALEGSFVLPHCLLCAVLWIMGISHIHTQLLWCNLFVIVITVNIVIDAYPSKVSGCFLRIHFYCKVSGLILHYRFCICTVKYYITKNIAPLMWPVLTVNKWQPKKQANVEFHYWPLPGNSTRIWNTRGQLISYCCSVLGAK